MAVPTAIEARTPATNRPCHNPQRWVEKVGRSIKGSDTPHAGVFGLAVAVHVPINLIGYAIEAREGPI